LTGDLSPSRLLPDVIRCLYGDVEFVVCDVVHSIDLACPASDRGETARQWFSRDSNQVRLSASTVAHHLIIFVPYVLNPVGAYGPLARDSGVEQWQTVDGGHIFETDQDVGLDEIVLTDGN
jgi:hypothetical protein